MSLLIRMLAGATLALPLLHAAEAPPESERESSTVAAPASADRDTAAEPKPAADEAKSVKKRAQPCQQVTGSKIRPRSDKDCEGRINAADTAVKPTMVDRAMHP